jgi:integrase
VDHDAVPYRDMPAFMGALRAKYGVSARALEFAILGAARTGEVIGAKWAEINLGPKLWAVPAARMKAGREHRVPLTDRASPSLWLYRAMANTCSRALARTSRSRTWRCWSSCALGRLLSRRFRLAGGAKSSDGKIRSGRS